jgi:hypothetical protein
MQPLSTSPDVPRRQALRQIMMVLLVTTGIDALVSFVIGLMMMGAMLVILRVLAPAFHVFGRSVQMLGLCVGACILLNLIVIAGWVGGLGRDWRQLAQVPRSVLVRMITRHDMAAAVSLALWSTFGGVLISQATRANSYIYLVVSLGVGLLLIHIYRILAHRLLRR